MRSVMVRGVSIGTGRPKIVVPLMGRDLDDLLREGEAAKRSPAQLAEWRLDWFDTVFDPGAVEHAALELRQTLGDLPLIATFRTQGEGGRRPATAAQYEALIHSLASGGQVDLIDLEASSGVDFVRRQLDFCRRHGVAVVLSSHDFASTPSQQEMVARLQWMEALGGDVVKLAVMPHSPEDVLALLAATRQASAAVHCPVVTMSMGSMGSLTRMAGELFGSALTFASLTHASAPGQVEVDALARAMDLFSPEKP